MMVGKLNGREVARTHDGDFRGMRKLAESMGVVWEKAPIEGRPDGKPASEGKGSRNSKSDG